MSLFDIFKKPSTEQILTTHWVVGTNLQQWQISEEYNNDLLFPQSIEIYDEMRKSDWTVIAILRAIKQPLNSAKWQIQSWWEDEKDKQISEFVNHNLFEKIHFKHFLSESLGFLDFGFYYFEKVYEIIDWKIEWKEFAPRIPKAHYLWSIQSKPKWIDWHPVWVTQQVNTTDEAKDNMFREIPWEKLILFTFEKEWNNFEWVSILRSAYKHYFYKDLLYKLWSISAERYGVWVPVAKIKSSTSKANKDKITEFIKNIRSNEQSYWIYTDDVETLEILTPNGTGIDMQTQIDHHDRKIYDSILAGFLNLTTGEWWSNALSKDQSSFFLRWLQWIADMFIDNLNRHIKELVDLNFNSVKNYPKLTVSDIGSISMDEAINSIGTAVEKWLIELNTNDKNDIRAILKLSPLQPQDEADIELAKLETELDLEQMQINTLESFQWDMWEDQEENVSEENNVVNQKMSEIFEEFYEYWKPLTQEHKNKIAEAIRNLKIESSSQTVDIENQSDFISWDKQVQSYEAQRQKLKNMADNVKLSMDNLKAKKSSMSKEDKKKFAVEFKTKIEELRQSRINLQNMWKDLKLKQKERSGFLKTYRKEVIKGVKTRKKQLKDKEREDKRIEKEKIKAEKELEKAKKKAEKESKKKDKNLAEKIEPTKRENVFTENITIFEKYLNEKYNEAEKIVKEAEKEYKTALEELYSNSPSTRIDWVICLVYDKKMINKGNKLVEKITNKLQTKLIDSTLQDEIFNQAMESAKTNLEDNNKYLAYKVDIKQGQVDTFINGYKSNMQGVIYNESRRVLENITLNYWSEASVDLAKNTADININKNILALSFVTHPRALYKYIIYNESQSAWFALFKVLVPDNKIQNVVDRPFWMTASIVFTINTAAQINKAVSIATEWKTAEAVTWLWLHHWSFEYYYPIESVNLDTEQEISKQQREWLQTQIDFNNK